MNKTRIRTIVIIIVTAAIGISIFLGVRYREGKQVVTTAVISSEAREPDQSANDGIPQESLQNDDILEQTPEPAPDLAPVIPTSPGAVPAQAGTGIQPKKDVISPSLVTLTPSSSEDQLKNALVKAAEQEDYATLGTLLAEVYKRFPQGKKEFVEIESRAYVKATSYLDQEKNTAKALAAADAVYRKHPLGWRFKYLRVRSLERLGRDAFAASDLAGAEKYALTMLQMEYRPEGANLMADIYLKRIDDALAKSDKTTAQNAYNEIKDYEVSPDRRKALDERLKKISAL